MQPAGWEKALRRLAAADPSRVVRRSWAASIRIGLLTVDIHPAGIELPVAHGVQRGLFCHFHNLFRESRIRAHPIGSILKAGSTELLKRLIDGVSPLRVVHHVLNAVLFVSDLASGIELSVHLGTFGVLLGLLDPAFLEPVGRAAEAIEAFVSFLGGIVIFRTMVSLRHLHMKKIKDMFLNGLPGGKDFHVVFLLPFPLFLFLHGFEPAADFAEMVQ